MSLEIDYDLDQIAEAVGMSTRWVRDRVKEGAAHQRYGNKIKMTAEQVALLRAAHTKEPAPVESITTGRRKRAS
jgi:predicted DNA-binding protein YlxM (UPF0122 family)